MAIRIKSSRTLLLSLSIPTPPSSSSSYSSFSSSPSSEDETLISTAVSILRHHRSKSRWNYLKNSLPNRTGFSPSESTQIILRIRNNPRLALRFFLWSHRHSLCHHDLSSYSTIIHVLARSRLRSEALSLIQSAIRIHDSESDNPLELFQILAKSYRACDSAPFVFDLLIKAYLQSKKLDRAVQIVRILRSRGIEPLISTSNSLIRSISQAKGSDAGFEIYRELFGEVKVRVSPNVQTFNTLLLAFYRDGNLEMVKEIQREMERFNCDQNVFTYSILMAGFCDEGMVDEAIKIWTEMAENNIKPDIMAFNTIIKGYCEAKEMERAEELFREMVLSEIDPTGNTYEYMIKGYCKVGNIDSALLLYKDMRRRDYGVENLIVDEMIEGLCDRRRVSEGLGILRDEMRREGFGPSRRSYELLIKGFCEEGEMEAALKLQAEMAGRGFNVDSKVYGDFIEGYRSLGDEEVVRKLEDEMLKMALQKEGD